MVPTPLFTVNNSNGNYLNIPNQLVTIATTYLTRDTSGASNVNVQNGLDFSADQLVLLNSIGNENCEVVSRVSSATSVLINFTSSYVFNHTVGEPISSILYDQIIIESATSLTGSYSVLATIPFQFSSTNTIYYHAAGASTTAYRIKFKNSYSTVVSDYSDPAVSSSFGSTTAGYLINEVRALVGNTTLPDEFFISAINDARKVVNTNFAYGRVNEWREEFEFPIQMLAGRNYVELPSDIDFNETNRTLLNARYARQSVAANLPIAYVDKRRWNSVAYQNRYSTTTAAVLIGATSMTLTTTGDFPASGTVFAATDDPTQSIITITYTGNNLATNTLTGVSGVTRNLPADCQIWAYSTFSYPFFFTVYDNRLWFERPIPTALQGKNLYLDYYKKMVDITYMSDVLPEHFRDCYRDYLKFAIKRRRDDSIGENDEDYKRFISSLKVILGNPYTGQFQIVIT